MKASNQLLSFGIIRNGLIEQNSKKAFDFRKVNFDKLRNLMSKRCWEEVLRMAEMLNFVFKISLTKMEIL